MKFKIAFFLLPLYMNPAFSLVEYSDNASFHSGKSSSLRRPKAIKVKKRMNNASSRAKKRSLRKISVKNSPSFLFDLAMGYESNKASFPQGEGTLGFYTLRGRFQTNMDFYIDFDYWHTMSNKGIFANRVGEKKGNPSVKIGLNWLRVGKPAYQSVINFYAGTMLPMKDTLFASSRSDKMFGLETSKRFLSFLLALGFDLRLTGTPSDVGEMDVGNISTIMGGFSWMATPDIRFVLESASVKIRASSDENRAIRNESDLSFSYISPHINLTLSPFVNFKMGGRFNSKRIENKSQLNEARLWDLKAVLGNSFFTELSIAI